MEDKTRLKMTLLFLGVTILEGLLKVALKGFPLTEVFSFQAILWGGYVTAKTISNIDEAKYEVEK